MDTKKINGIALYILSAIIVAGFFTSIWLLIAYNVPENNRDLLNISLGSLIAAFTGVIGYFFGSSAGSKEKTEQMNKNL